MTRPIPFFFILLCSLLVAPPARATSDRDLEALLSGLPILPEKANERVTFGETFTPTQLASMPLRIFFSFMGTQLDINLYPILPADSQLLNRPVGIEINNATKGELLSLVLQVHNLKAVQFNRRTVLIVPRNSTENYGRKTKKIYRLTYTKPQNIVDFITQSPSLSKVVSPASVIPHEEGNSILVLDTPQVVAVMDSVVNLLDAKPNKIQARIPISFLDKAEFDAAIANLGADIQQRIQTADIYYSEEGRSLILYDTPENVEFLRNVVRKIDLAPRQVLIDTAIMTVESTFTRELGIRLTANGFTVDRLDKLLNQQRLNRHLEATTQLPTAAQITYILNKNGAQTLANPKIRTLDGERANIVIGDIIVVQIVSQTAQQPVGGGQQIQQNVTPQEVTTGVQLSVEPTIHHDRTVTLDLTISNDQPRQVLPFGVNRSTTNSTTKLRVKDGETIILGGFINKNNSYNKDPVPILGEIPFLRSIFNANRRSRTNSELVFLLTPYILEYVVNEATGEAELPRDPEAVAAEKEVNLQISALDKDVEKALKDREPERLRDAETGEPVVQNIFAKKERKITVVPPHSAEISQELADAGALIGNRPESPLAAVTPVTSGADGEPVLTFRPEVGREETSPVSEEEEDSGPGGALTELAATGTGAGPPGIFRSEAGGVPVVADASARISWGPGLVKGDVTGTVARSQKLEVKPDGALVAVPADSPIGEGSASAVIGAPPVNLPPMVIPEPVVQNRAVAAVAPSQGPVRAPTVDLAAKEALLTEVGRAIHDMVAWKEGVLKARRDNDHDAMVAYGVMGDLRHAVQDTVRWKDEVLEQRAGIEAARRQPLPAPTPVPQAIPGSRFDPYPIARPAPAAAPTPYPAGPPDGRVGAVPPAAPGAPLLDVRPGPAATPLFSLRAPPAAPAVASVTSVTPPVAARLHRPISADPVPVATAASGSADPAPQMAAVDPAIQRLQQQLQGLRAQGPPPPPGAGSSARVPTVPLVPSVPSRAPFAATGQRPGIMRAAPAQVAAPEPVTGTTVPVPDPSNLDPAIQRLQQQLLDLRAQGLLTAPVAGAAPAPEMPAAPLEAPSAGGVGRTAPVIPARGPPTGRPAGDLSDAFDSPASPAREPMAAGAGARDSGHSRVSEPEGPDFEDEPLADPTLPPGGMPEPEDPGVDPEVARLQQQIVDLRKKGLLGGPGGAPPARMGRGSGSTGALDSLRALEAGMGSEEAEVDPPRSITLESATPPPAPVRVTKRLAPPAKPLIDIQITGDPAGGQPKIENRSAKVTASKGRGAGTGTGKDKVTGTGTGKDKGTGTGRGERTGSRSGPAVSEESSDGDGPVDAHRDSNHFDRGSVEKRLAESRKRGAEVMNRTVPQGTAPAPAPVAAKAPPVRSPSRPDRVTSPQVVLRRGGETFYQAEHSSRPDDPQFAELEAALNSRVGETRGKEGASRANSDQLVSQLRETLDDAGPGNSEEVLGRLREMVGSASEEPAAAGPRGSGGTRVREAGVTEVTPRARPEGRTRVRRVAETPAGATVTDHGEPDRELLREAKDDGEFGGNLDRLQNLLDANRERLRTRAVKRGQAAEAPRRRAPSRSNSRSAALTELETAADEDFRHDRSGGPMPAAPVRRNGSLSGNRRGDPLERASVEEETEGGESADEEDAGAILERLRSRVGKNGAGAGSTSRTRGGEYHTAGPRPRSIAAAPPRRAPPPEPEAEEPAAGESWESLVGDLERELSGK